MNVSDQIAQAIITRGPQFFLVSTVLLHREPFPFILAHNSSAPYETMIFPCDEHGEVTDWSGEYCKRYETEIKAREGHKRACLEWAKA